MVVERLAELQKRDGLTDAQMGEKLGMHGESWNRLKRGRSAPHEYKFLCAAVRAFPSEMGPVIVRELLGENYQPVLAQMMSEIVRDMAGAKS